MKIEKNTHVGAYGFIIKDEKIALIKKARGGYTGLLDIPGGGIEHDETPVEALKREIMEEAGVTVSDYDLLTATSRKRGFIKGRSRWVGFEWVQLLSYCRIKTI